MDDQRRLQLRESFAELVRRPNDEIDLARTALEVARIEYSRVAVVKSMQTLDRYGRMVSRRLKGSTNPFLLIKEINTLLFDEERFSPNERDYYDTRNSFLNDVLERKLAIPVTMSLVYMEIARRAGFAIDGLGLPGHFVVKISDDAGDILVDPYNKGEMLVLDDIRHRLREASVKPDQMNQYLVPLTNRQILARILTNLKGIYYNGGQYDKALAVVELMLSIYPWSMAEIRDRGMINYQLRSFGAALADLETYVKSYPDAPDSDRVKRSIQMLRPLADRSGVD
ncbi:MAG TPA: transglutaminase-like domain-containing protein [Dehalococcoidia bacterium]|nr:transglutaminase-like domain-containing protein [Dehalococcoidia bacterium]